MAGVRKIFTHTSLFLLPILLTSITFTSALILSSSPISAVGEDVTYTSTSANASVVVSAACTMTGSGMNSHTAEVPSGTYRADIGTTTIKVTCNDPHGFSIYAIGFSNDEYTGTNHTKLIGTNDNTKTIATGTATSGSTSNWAMKLASDNPEVYDMTIMNGYDSYSIVPDTYTKVAQRTSQTDIGTGAVGAELTTTYAAFISSTQQPDIYVGKVKYTMVHPYDEIPLQPQPATAGCINYFANGSGVTGEMGCQSASNNASVTLWAANFKRPGYGFAGWNTEFDYSGTTYGPNQDITTPSDVSTNGLSLYAVWVKSAGSLQNWSGCSGLAEGAITALTDERDGDTYAVAKLADGKCWMIENLRLADKDSNNNDINLSSSNTHNPSLPLNNSWYYREQQGTLTTSNHLSSTTNPTQIAWCYMGSSDCYDQSMLATNNTTLFTNNTASNYSAYSNVYSYGNYYNWYSATAGHGKYGSSYGSSFTAPGDICPAGWHLPTGKATTGEFAFLDIALGGAGSESSSGTTPTGIEMSKAWRTYPNNFIYTGYVRESSIPGVSSDGYYWSASGYDNNNAYLLNFTRSFVNPATNNDSIKHRGKIVRCVVNS